MINKIEVKKCIFVAGCIFIGSILVGLGVPNSYLISFFLGGAFFTIILDLFDKEKSKKGENLIWKLKEKDQKKDIG